MGPVRVGPAPGRVGESERQPGMAGAGEGRVRTCAGAVGRIARSAPALCDLRPGPGRPAAQTALVGSAAEQPGARPGFSGWALDPARPPSPLERSQAKTDLTRVTLAPRLLRPSSTRQWVQAGSHVEKCRGCGTDRQRLPQNQS